VDVQPSENTAVRKPCQVMMDRPYPVKRDRIRQRIGQVDADCMATVNRALAVFLGFA
jgi:mRNA interferase MazF